MPLICSWKRDRVGEDVVDVICAHGAGKTEMVHLHGCRSPGKDPCPCSFREAHQVNGNIDFHTSHHSGDVRIAFVANVDEMLKCRLESGAHLAPVVTAKGERDRLEAFLVEVLEHARGESRN